MNTAMSRAYQEATTILDQTGLPSTASGPTPGSGEGLLTYDTGLGLAIARSIPIAPFNAHITLTVNVADADGRASSAGKQNVRARQR
jgi:hypothetical protein